MHVCLISMPFGPLNFPSIALAQLTAAVQERFGNEIRVSIHYLVHDFGTAFGQEQYNSITHDPNCGDWIFSRVAFPEMPDNTDAYFGLVPNAYRDTYRDYYETHLKEACERIPELIETLIDKYALDQADVIGYTSMFAQTTASIAMAKAIRRRNPDVFQVMGGANCEFPMGIEYVHHFDCFDAIFSGPGLVSFPSFLEHLRNKDHDAIDRINGVFTRSNTVSAVTLPDNSPMRESAHVLIKNGISEAGDERPLGQWLPLDYDDFIDDYDRRFSRKIQEPFVVFETSRGCWWGQKSQCTFCGLNGSGMKYRSMDAECALRFLDDLIARYRGRVRRFVSADTILPPFFTREVLPYLNPPDDVSFFWEVKANLKTADLVALAQGHVQVIQPGIESLNTGTLRLMKKGVTSFTNVCLLRDAPMYAFDVSWNLLAGLPGEPESVYIKYLEDFPRLVHLLPPIAMIPILYCRFSPYYNEPEAYGLELVPATSYSCCYPLPEKAISNLAYYFRDVRQNREPAITDSDSNATAPDSGWSLPPHLERHWNALNDALAYWQTRFDGSDGKSKARLFYRPLTENEVIDTRSGIRVKYQLRPDEAAVLRYLNRSATRSGMRQAFPAIPDSRLSEILDRLHNDYRLLFHEEDRYCSLVRAHMRARIPPPPLRSSRSMDSKSQKHKLPHTDSGTT
jgi:ribosomal peptide maturation radical SAM protein 1